MRSHDWRQDITVPPARPFVPLCRTDRSTGSADYVPAFYDRTPSRLVSTIIFAFLPALSTATTASIGPPIQEATGNVASSLELAYFLLSFSRIFGVDRSFDRFLR